MAGEAEKRTRTITKRKFTRCHNRLNDYIIRKEGKDMIITKFEDLKLCWDAVQSAHDNYLFAKYPDAEDEITQEDEDWLTELEERYEVMQKAKCDHLREIDLAEQMDNRFKEEENLANQSNANIVITKKNRESSKLLLIQEIRGIEELIKMDKNKLLKSQVIAGVKDVKVQLEKCKDSHVSYTANLSVEEGRRESEWIESIYSLYEELNRKIYEYIESVTEHEQKERKKIDMKMERLKMPSFAGNIRNYAKFKSDFRNQVEIQVW